MMSIIQTLLLASVALMAAASGRLGHAGTPTARGLGVGVTRFVCAHCTSTGQLSSGGLFLNRASVQRHNAASKHCRAADLGYWEIQVEAQAGDVMAGVGGAAGPAPDVRHQPPGDTAHAEQRRLHIFPGIESSRTDAFTLAAKWLDVQKVCMRSLVRIL